MPKVAKVAVANTTYSIDRPYDYILPDELLGQAQVGCRVLVPFGQGNKASEALILAIADSQPQRELKSVARVLDAQPVLSAEGVKMALWLRERCFCTLYDVIKSMLPAGMYYRMKDSYSIMPGIDRETAYDAAGKSKNKKKLLEVIYANGGQCDSKDLLAAFDDKLPTSAVKELVSQDILFVETSVMRMAADKVSDIASLAVSPEEALAYAASKKRSAPLQSEVLTTLASIGEASVKELCYFTGASTVTVKTLAKKGYVSLRQVEAFRRPTVEESDVRDKPVLSPQQQEAYEGLKKLMFQPEAAVGLLYGVTGSGKTQVYISLIYDILIKNKTALVLVPEISLTPQLMKLFAAHFGDSVAILHSSLRTTERYDEWKRVKSGRARVVIGTRSAVFAPLDNIGLIIIDEEHEQTYKSESNPRYNARDVAKYRCAYHNALLVLGSATPSVETMFSAVNGTYSLFRLDSRFNQRELPRVIMADIKREFEDGNFGSIGSVLRDEIAKNLEKDEQTILFLNRRGTSRLVCCSHCGYIPQCDRCSVKLTYHQVNGRLMCHYCGRSVPVPQFCPECGGELKLVGYGTQHLEQELEELFPGIKTIRMDADTVSSTNTHEKILSEFEKKKIPVLIGTQMVTKGLDFENVTLVGVIDADLSLYASSFRANERTFSQITQVVGRAGRGEKEGRAVIQTMTPLNKTLNFAAVQDYDGFFEEELQNRSILQCPPFGDHLVLTFSGQNEKMVENSALTARRVLQQTVDREGLNVRLLGPAPAYISKVNNRHRYCLTLVCRVDKRIRNMIEQFLKEYARQRSNRGVVAFADVNPFE